MENRQSEYSGVRASSYSHFINRNGVELELGGTDSSNMIYLAVGKKGDSTGTVLLDAENARWLLDHLSIMLDIMYHE